MRRLQPRHLMLCTLALTLGLTAPATAAERRVCVEVQLRLNAPRLAASPRPRPPASQPTTAASSVEDPPASGADGAGELLTPQAARRSLAREALAPPGERRKALHHGERRSHRAPPDLPLGQTPLDYLRRLLEHYVTHERGFVAVSGRCAERLRVELYPLQVGWTAFARYSGNGREERVDQLYEDEISQFAERAVEALLQDRPISATIKRDTVLRADSKRSRQRILGTHHFLLGLGTQIRLGRFATAQDNGGTRARLRAFSPMTIAAGYQGKFESWSVKTLASLGIGTSRTGVRQNSAGGHVDLGGDFGISLHVLRYLNPRGISSFYLGAGSTFEVLWFSMIKPLEAGGDRRTTLVSGGLDVDLLCGWEFMRASAVQFFLEGGLQLPAYVVQSDNDYGGIDTWFPGVAVKLGVVF